MRRGWPPFRRRWVPAALRPAHRSRGTTEAPTASACFCVCVSVPPLDRCRAQRAPPACIWHLLTTPGELARWSDTKLIEGPDRELRAGDRLVLGAGIGHRLKV